MDLIMISNPYAKASGDIRKRQNRPWESNSIPTELVRNDNDGFENGIDWNQVVRECEPMFANHSQQPCEVQDPRDAKSESDVGCDRTSRYCSLTMSSPVVCLERYVPHAKPNKTTINRDHVKFSHEEAIQNATTCAGQVPHRPSSVAELRPISWKVDKTVSRDNDSKRNTTSKCSDAYGDDRQLSLPPSLQFDPKLLEPIQDDKRQSLVKHANLSQPMLNGWTLFPHQKQSILAGLLMRRIILALDMGMGKTLIGCVWSRAFVNTFDALSVVVVCPVTLKEIWQRTFLECTGLSVGEVNNLDATTNVFVTSWSKIPSPIQVTGSLFKNYVVVADEAHYMQNMQTTRTQDALKLMKASQCVGVLLLSGTPMKNGKPSNIFPLLHAVKHPFGKNQRAFEAYFCGGHEISLGRGKTVWQANGSSNLDQLKELTKSHMLYLKKEDCLKNLPTLTRITKHVPVSSRMQIQHDRGLTNLAKIYASTEIESENRNERILGAVQSLRVVDSFAKVEATVQLAQQILTDEAAVVIFTSFQQVAGSVCKKLNECGWHSELLTGETPPKLRQSMVDNFQNGLSSAFVCTFGAGGTGLTLTAAHTVILVDRPRTPGDVFQAEDRIRRIDVSKKTREVKSIWLSAFDLDKQIDEMIDQKSRTSSAVLCQKTNKSYSSDVPKINIFKLLETLLFQKTTSPAQSRSPDLKLKQTSILQFSQSDRVVTRSSRDG